MSGVPSHKLWRIQCRLCRFWQETGGGILITFSILLPVMLMVAGAAVDFSLLIRDREKLQTAVDASAMAAAKELIMADFEASRVQAVAESVIASHVGKDISDVSVNTKLDQETRSVSVEATHKMTGGFLAQLLELDTTISVSATAQSVGQTALCVLGLEEDFPGGTVSLQSNARLTGNGCAVYSNSTRTGGLVVKDGGVLKADLICTAGGKIGAEGSFDPTPLTDCPPLSDPLESRVEPTVGSCTEYDMVIGEKPETPTYDLKLYFGAEAVTSNYESTGTAKYGAEITLNPGTYCGGLIINGDVRVRLNPGVYIMKDGPLHVDGRAVLDGEHVGFFFSGLTSTLYFGQGTTINLSAPKRGVMAGILFFEARRSFPLRQFTILSDNARVLLGTIYLPQAFLFVDAYQPIADKSAYTVVITRRISLFSGPHLVLNTNYSATDVPVPDGILSSANANVVLKE